ncbi:MAG: efflux RND transporter periplasmic adaptor subunit [Planctomycetales bacterium]|nr:efflux RND transporter periplasmic adaptor subunit [Planctomycetales bacterium]
MRLNAILLGMLGCGLCLSLASGCGHSQADEANRSVTTSQKSGEVVARGVSVQAVTPKRRDLVAKFEQPGVVEASAQADLYSHVSGYVKAIHVDIGDFVKKGAVLLEVDVPELEQELAFKEALVGQAQAELSQAQAGVVAAQGALDTHPSQVQLADAEVRKALSDREFRKKEFERYAGLAADNTATRQQADEKQSQYQAARSAHDSSVAKQQAVRMELTVLKARLTGAEADVKTKQAKISVATADREKTRVLFDYAKLKAPFDGTVTHRTVDEGEYVHSPNSDKATPPFTLAKTQWVTLVMRVPEKEVPSVQIGNRVTVEFDALRGQPVTGQVSRVARSVEAKSRTMRVEIDVENPDQKLYPGMFGSVTLVLSNVKQALTVPASALYGTVDGLFVVCVKDNVARRTKVQTGYDDGRIVQIVSGLSGNEEVVVSNKGELSDGQRVAATRVD